MPQIGRILPQIQFEILIFLSIVILTYQEQSEERTINTVYSPFYLNKYDFQNKGEVPLQIKIAYDSELVYIASGFGGLIVIDQKGQEKLYQQSLDSEFIKTIDVSRDGKLLMVGLKGKMNIYQSNSDFSDQNNHQKYSLLSQIKFPTEILSILYIEDLKIVIAAGLNGHIVAYDITKLEETKQFAQFDTNSPQITSIFISKDNKWIYLSCDIVGIIVLQLKIEQRQSPIKGSFILAAQGQGYRKSWQVVATSDNKYIFEIENWFGIYYANNEQVLNSNLNQFPITLQFKAYWPLKQINPVCTILLISQNDKLLFVGVRSIGILVFDISKREDIQYFQHIQVDALSVYAALSKKEDFLYYSNSLSIYTFQMSIPNLQNDFPNIFNTQQALQRDMDGIFKWRCYVDPSNSYLIGSFDYSGFYIIPFNNDPLRLQLSKQTHLDIETDSMFLDIDQKYLYIPRLYGEQLINVFSVSPTKDNPNISLTNPKQVASFNVDTVQMAEQLIFSKDKRYAIQTYQTGMMFLNMTNPIEIKLLFYWPSPESMTGETGGGAITDDNNWIIGMVRNFGIYVLDARNKTNLVLVDYIETLGAESITLSKILPNYAYICDGMRGFAIMDLSVLPKIKIVSRILLQGWTQLSIPIYNDNFVLVCQQDNGMLSLIDTRDKLNPKVISTFRRDKQYAVAMCTTIDEKYVFLTSPVGIITLPLFSKVTIHTEVNVIMISELTGLRSITTFQREQNQEEFIFQVGQIIQLNFVILYPQDEDMRIIYVKTYESNQVLDIPYYMKYDLSSQTLIINVDKQALGEKRDQNLNIILIKTVIPLSNNSFIYTLSDESDFAVTNETQANFILKYLVNKNYLDSKKTISEYFDPSKEFQFDDSFILQFQKSYQQSQLSNYDTFIQQLQEKVRITLMQSSFINPFKFQVQSSLQLNFDNPLKFISSINISLITVFLQIQTGGKFVERDYSGVITSTSQLGDKIKIEGSLANINNVLYQMIVFAHNTTLNDQEISKIEVLITIIDNINYPLIITQQMVNCKFIVLKKKIAIMIPLQQQIEKQFQNSIVDIETDISISFSQKSFQVSDTENIAYKIQIKSSSPSIENDGYTDISPDFWLQSQSNQGLNFYGKIPSTMFKEIFHFKIIANDGYTQAEDYFQLNAQGVPLFYIINNLIKILGPIIAIIGIYEKRAFILNIIYKKSVFFDDEISYCDQKYIKRIVILGKVIEDSKQIVTHLLKKVNTERISNSNDDNNFQTSFKKINFDEVIENETENKKQQSQIEILKLTEIQLDILSIQRNNNNHDNSPRDIELSPINNNNQNEIQFINQSPEKNNKIDNTNSSYQQVLNRNLNGSSRIILSKNDGNSNEGSPQRVESQRQIKFIKKIQKRVSNQYQHIQQSTAEKLFLKETGCINMQNVVEYILKYNLTFGFNSTLKGQVDYTEDLKDSHSRIHNAVKAQLARHFLSQNKKSQMAYDCIKEYCLLTLKKSENCWYKCVVNIIPTENHQQNKKQIIFPQIELNYKIMKDILIHLQILKNKEYQIDSFDQLYNHIQQEGKGINIFLIKEVIFADTLGLSSDTPSNLHPSQGESIHLHPYEIKSIQAFKKVNGNKCYRSFLSLLNLDYMRYGVSKNMRLPTWLSLDQKYGVILFEGIPSNLDIEEILIRIIDIDNYVVMQFNLKIIPSPNKFNIDVSNSIPEEDNQIIDRLDKYESNGQPIFASHNMNLRNQQLSQVSFSQFQ